MASMRNKANIPVWRLSKWKEFWTSWNFGDEFEDWRDNERDEQPWVRHMGVRFCTQFCQRRPRVVYGILIRVEL